MSSARRLIFTAMPFLCIAFFVFSSVVKIPVKAAAACPEAPPVPLRVLYQRSERVVVARIENSVEDKVTEEYEQGKWIQIRKSLSVHTNLKGEDAGELVLIDSDYKENPTFNQNQVNAEEVVEDKETLPQSETAEIVSDEREPVVDKLAVGKRLLLFLKKSDSSEDGYELTDYRYGAKELSDADLRVYELRLRELKEILSAHEEQNEKIVAWLIRCAEEPATRWEGVSELEDSFNNYEIGQRLAQEQREKAKNNENQENSESGEGEEFRIEPESFNYGGNPIFSQLLTATQKDRLTSILLGYTFEPKTQNEETGFDYRADGLMELVSLVRRWDGERLVPYLKANLANVNESSPYQAAQFMTIIAELLENEKLTAIAEKYEAVSYEDGAAEVVKEESEENADSSQTAENSETNAPEIIEVKQQTTEENSTEAETTEAESAVENDQPKKQTYKELREEILNEFLAAAEKSLAKQQRAAR